MTTTLTEVDTYTADVTVPEGGDARTAGSVQPAFQALANRTKNLLGRFAALAIGLTTQAVAYASPQPTEWRNISLLHALNSSTGADIVQIYVSGVLYFGAGVGHSANPTFPIALPKDSTFDAVRVSVKPTVDNDVNMTVYRKTVDPTSGAITRVPLNSSPANVPAGSARTFAQITLDAPENVNNSGTEYEVFISGGATVTLGHFVEVHAMQVHATYYYITPR